jgi:hypothetical protein
VYLFCYLLFFIVNLPKIRRKTRWYVPSNKQEMRPSTVQKDYLTANKLWQKKNRRHKSSYMTKRIKKSVDRLSGLKSHRHSNESGKKLYPKSVFQNPNLLIRTHRNKESKNLSNQKRIFDFKSMHILSTHVIISDMFLF